MTWVGGSSAGAQGVRFRIFDWLPVEAKAVWADLEKTFHLDREHLPALQQDDPGTMTLVNTGGAPAAIAYAPLRLDSLVTPPESGSQARPRFQSVTLRFQARGEGETKPLRAGVSFATRRLDFEVSPHWKSYALSASLPGPMGPDSIAISLRARKGRLEIRGLQLARAPFQAEAGVIMEMPSQDPWSLGVHFRGTLVPGLSLAMCPVAAANVDPSVPEGIGSVPFASAPRGQSVGPGGTISTEWTHFFPLPPAATAPGKGPRGMRWWLLDADGRVALAGGEAWFADQPVAPRGPRRRDVSIATDGTLLVEGRRRLPLGLYTHEASEQAIADAASAGLDLVIMPPQGDVASLVAFARARGVEVILENSVPADKAAIPKAVEDIVARYASLPLLAWTAIDEPDLKPAHAAVVGDVYRALAAADSRPVYQSNHSPSTFAHLGQAADILAVDPYPVATVPRPLATVGAWLDEARACVGTALPGGVGPQRSVWLIQQAFAEAPLWTRPPTPAELRAMTWIGLNHGARGIVFYALHEILYPGSPDHKWDLRRTDLMAEIRREAKEIRSLEPYLLEGTPVKVSTGGPLDATWWQRERGGLVSVVNLDDHTTRGWLRLRSDVPSVRMLPSGPTVDLVDGAMEIEMAPYGVVLLEVPAPTSPRR